MPATTGAETGLSRRALFGAGLGRALDARPAAAAPAGPLPDPAEVVAQLAPVAEHLGRLAGAAGPAALAVGAWPSPPATAQAVPARLPLPAADASHDAVLGWFDVTYLRDPARVAAELRRVAAPGAVIAVAAWTRPAARMLGRSGDRDHRPHAWSRFETAYRLFFDLPCIDLVDGTVEVALAPGEAPVELGYSLVTAAVPRP